MNITTKTSGKNPEETSVGEYVKYEPNSSSTYSSTQEYNGNSTVTVSRENLNWRILKVSGTTATLISDPTSNTVTYKGAEGYNNAVLDLNNMRKTLYSHGSTYARSVNLEDFKGNTAAGNFSPSTSGGTLGSSYNKVPTIYPQEYTGSLGQSQQYSYVSGSTTPFSSAKNNYWTGSISSSHPLYSPYLYWLGSRFVYYDNYAQVALFYLGRTNASLSSNNATLWRSDDLGAESANLRVRAVTSLPSSVKFESNGDANSAETGYSIIW